MNKKRIKELNKLRKELEYDFDKTFAGQKINKYVRTIAITHQLMIYTYHKYFFNRKDPLYEALTKAKPKTKETKNEI